MADFSDLQSRFEPETAKASEAPREIVMKHPRTGSMVVAPIGFCVPVLLLGPIPILMRGNWRLALITTLACVGLPIAGQIFMAYYANRMHLKDLLRWGFCAVSNERGRISRIEWMLGLQLPRYAGRRSTAG